VDRRTTCYALVLCPASKTVTSGHGIICERGYEVRLGLSVCAGIVEDNVMGPYMLPDMLTARRCCDFMGTVLQELLEDVYLAVRQNLLCQHNSSSWGRHPAVAGWWTIHRGADCVAYSAAVSNSEDSKCYRGSCGYTRRSCDNGRCANVEACSIECRAFYCLLP
jgi:hypothetical protein